MDLLAHALWAGAGVALLRRRRPVDRRTVALTVGLAVLPDIPHLLPVAAWSLLGSGSIAAIGDYATAQPGDEPALPAAVESMSHHLHCTMHSAIVAGAVTLLLAWRLRALWLPLLGWWSHIVIDVFTHSADYYAVPVLYPLTMRGFDGVAWNAPWFVALNYAALLGLYAALAWQRHRRRRAGAARAQAGTGV